MPIFETQQVVEALAETSPPTQINSVVIEAMASANPHLTVEQIVAELLLDPGPTNLDLGQIVVELLTDPPPPGGGIQIQPVSYYFGDRDTPLDRLVAPFRSLNIYRLYNLRCNKNPREY